MKNVILMDAIAGSTFEECAKNAQSRCLEDGRKDVCVSYSFNGVQVRVDRGTNLELLLRDYDNAHLMDWNEIGPECVQEYAAETKAEIDRRHAAWEKNQEAQRLSWEEEARQAREKFEKMVAGIELEFSEGGKEKWDQGLIVNSSSEDPTANSYGQCIFAYAKGWALLMQKTASDNGGVIDQSFMETHAKELSFKLDFLGISGFMYGAAVSILSECWKYGELLHKWHNGEYGAEDQEGVVNPAIMTISTASAE